MNLTESGILENSSNSALPLSLSSTSRMSRNVLSLLELQTGFLWFSFILLPVYDLNLTQFSFWNFWRSVATTSSFFPCLALNNQNVSSLTFVRLIFEALYEGVLLQKFESVSQFRQNPLKQRVEIFFSILKFFKMVSLLHCRISPIPFFGPKKLSYYPVCKMAQTESWFIVVILSVAF